VVSHGAAMAVALAALIDHNPGAWTHYHFGNCSLTELVLHPSPYVNFFNSIHHL
jgi:broad specificity phosphatase PhoE